MSEYYTAREAAAVLQLKYHTFLARAHAGKYEFEKVGWAILFLKSSIDKAAKNDPSSEAVEKTAG